MVQSSSPPQDHPRVCGEKMSNLAPRSFIMGSPPRMRGKAAGTVARTLVLGITPAYAGKRVRNRPRNRNSRDHPRVCVEKSFCACSALHLEGSPPRMRGKAAAGILCPVCGGITPAYAGKRNTHNKRIGGHQDHPRVCGEKAAFDFQLRHGVGSPPRMRGKAQKTEKSAGRCRITPAYAGKRRA